MQTAEEFARIILANCMVDLSYAPRLAELLQADRAAAKLDVLDEMLDLGANASIATINRLRAKYASQAGVSNADR